MAAVLCCHGFLSEPRMGGVEGWAVMPRALLSPGSRVPACAGMTGWADCADGWDGAPPFCPYAAIALGTSPLFRTWLGGGGVCV